jgi:peptidoglycan L-alanyl-D-glutamate endopeptidase CwlK
MPRFSSASSEKLKSCHPDLQTLFNEVIKYFDCTIIEGYRNKEAQDKAFNSGHSMVQYPKGKHNKIPSMAVDVIAYPINWNDEKLGLWFGGYVLGIAQQLKNQGKMTHSIRWGGSWNGFGKLNSPKQFNDLVHFEIIS